MPQQPALTVNEQKVSDLWKEHLRTEFNAHSADEAIATMVADPLVNQVPVMIGGVGKDELYEFYGKYFLPQIPPDWELVPVGSDPKVSVSWREILFSQTPVDNRRFPTHPLQGERPCPSPSGNPANGERPRRLPSHRAIASRRSGPRFRMSSSRSRPNARGA